MIAAFASAWAWLAPRSAKVARWLPEPVWIALVGAAVLWGGWRAHVSSVELARLEGLQQGIRETRAIARGYTDSLLAGERRHAEHQLDSVRRVLDASRAQVRAQLPTIHRQATDVRTAAAAVRAQPATITPRVGTLVDRSERLADSTDVLATRVAAQELRITAVEQASDSLHAVDGRALLMMGINYGAQVDSTRLARRERDWRPTRKKAAAIALASAGACHEWCDDVGRWIRDMLRRRRQ